MLNSICCPTVISWLLLLLLLLVVENSKCFSQKIRIVLLQIEPARLRDDAGYVSGQEMVANAFQPTRIVHVGQYEQLNRVLHIYQSTQLILAYLF